MQLREFWRAVRKRSVELPDMNWLRSGRVAISSGEQLYELDRDAAAEALVRGTPPPGHARGDRATPEAGEHPPGRRE
jgi:hypothetical protein